MSVIRTDKWLLDSYNKPIEICEKIKVHFDGAPAYEIYDYLILHGMYRPIKNGNELVKKLQKKKYGKLYKRKSYIFKKCGKDRISPSIFSRQIQITEK